MPIDSKGPCAASSSASARWRSPAPAAPHLHQCVVEVGDGTQRPSSLLVEDVACLLEPLPRFVEAAGKGTKACQREARVGVGIAEVASVFSRRLRSRTL